MSILNCIALYCVHYKILLIKPRLIVNSAGFNSSCVYVLWTHVLCEGSCGKICNKLPWKYLDSFQRINLVFRVKCISG